MMQQVVVVYDGTVLRPETPVDLEVDRRYVVTVVREDEAGGREDAWDVLDALAGTVDAPTDWAAEHDHYLYDTPKRQADDAV